MGPQIWGLGTRDFSTVSSPLPRAGASRRGGGLAVPKRGTCRGVALAEVLEGLIAKLGFSGKAGSLGTETVRVSSSRKSPCKGTAM